MGPDSYRPGSYSRKGFPGIFNWLDQIAYSPEKGILLLAFVCGFFDLDLIFGRIFRLVVHTERNRIQILINQDHCSAMDLFGSHAFYYSAASVIDIDPFWKATEIHIFLKGFMRMAEDKGHVTGHIPLTFYKDLIL